MPETRGNGTPVSAPAVEPEHALRSHGDWFSEAPRGSLASHVERRIREALMMGRFRPGEKLNIRELASMVGTSATPVREALIRLAAEHAIEMRPAHSARVPVLSREQYAELLVIRKSLEGLAGEVATGRIRDPEIDAIAKLLDKLVKATASQDLERTLIYSYRFRFGIYRAAAMPTLLRLIEGLWIQSSPNFSYFIMHDDALTRAYRGALEAVRQRDAVATRNWIEQAIDVGAARLHSYLEASGTGGA